MSKKDLEVALSKIKGFERPKVKKEQYMTPSEIASDIIWTAYMSRDVENKIVCDFGAGTGILGLGFALLGAKKVYLVESESSALEIAKKNYEMMIKEYGLKAECVFIEGNIEGLGGFEEEIDVIVQNPPFGTKTKHADREFLIKAMETAEKVYSVHKMTSEGFIQALCEDMGFEIKGIKEYKWCLKASYKHHKKKIEHILAGLWILEKVRNE